MNVSTACGDHHLDAATEAAAGLGDDLIVDVGKLVYNGCLQEVDFIVGMLVSSCLTDSPPSKIKHKTLYSMGP